MPTSGESFGRYLPQYTLTEYSNGVPRYPSVESTNQVHVDVENLDDIPSTNNVLSSKNSKLVTVGTVLGAVILVCLLATSIAVPFVVSYNRSLGSFQATSNSSTTSGPTITITTVSITTTATTTSTTSTASTTSTTSTATSTTTSTTTTTQNPYACGNMTYLIGYDLGGSDITSNTLANYTLCCAWCRSYNGCVSYTWGLSTAGSAAFVCFLKNAVPAAAANSGLVSAHY